MDNKIVIRGAREHNLKNINLKIPKNKLVAFTGVSGSGKTSLAMDTIFAEGQRRYVESLSSYARQFLGVLKRADVDQIEGLCPSIAIDQKAVSHNPRSTVGTITEVYDYLRLLFARIGHPHCPWCGREVSSQSAQKIVDNIFERAKNKGSRLMVLAPVVRDKKGEYSALFANLKKQGYTDVRVDGEVRGLDEGLVLIKTNRHSIDVVVDRAVIENRKPSTANNLRLRLTDSVEKALRLADGLVIIGEVKDASFEFPQKPKKIIDYLGSEKFACPVCNISLSDLEPSSFSFNSPHGACPECQGLGTQLKIDPDLLVNPRLSLAEGGILPWSSLMERDTWTSRVIKSVAQSEGISLNDPIAKIPQGGLQTLLYGGGDRLYEVTGRNRYGRKRTFDTRFEGLIPNLTRRYRKTDSDYIRREIGKYMIKELCPKCRGSRLKDTALSVMVTGKNIAEAAALPINKLQFWVAGLTEEGKIAALITKELLTRLQFLNDVGLSYLTINRSAETLSAGEAQRIRLASQIGAGLSGVLYVLDEPSIGLHHRDQKRLIKTLYRLRDLKNTVIVVEHDSQTILGADWVVDFGPGAGEEGGEVVSQGTPREIMRDKNSLTGQYLSGKKKIKSEKLKVKSPAQSSKQHKLMITGCREHNLKDITVEIPLGKLVCVTGVSGSGKSTLVNETLHRALRAQLGLRIEQRAGDHDRLEGAEEINRVISIDQSPIGRTPRSNPATYTKVFDEIRRLLAKTTEAKIRGYRPGRFSFNVKGGRCQACRGEGQLKIEMQFMPDAYVDCEVCGGKRYNRETLEVEYKEKNIAEVLDLSVGQAREFFKRIPIVREKLQTLIDVGLVYIKLGQPAPTLSGGEAQRVKLARELSKRSTGKTFCLLDEPTTGLHFEDLKKLLFCLRRLVEQGNTVVIIEHNLDVIRNADWIIDLGPEGGDEGGKVVACGTVRDIINNHKSHTGQALRSANSKH